MEADEEATGNIQELYNLDPQLQVGLKEVATPKGIFKLVTGLWKIKI